MISHEIKSQLAKLLATEDLIVENRKVETAQFNVHTRVLTLPIWSKASNTVYDLLVGHEVGHALFTPDEDLPKTIPHQFINVVEDARIEKLMKRKYPGLAKTFFGGYKELNEEDFFNLEDEDISSMNLADRANLLFKIGNHIQIPIESGEETEIINMIGETETFTDVLLAAEALYKFCKQKQQEETKIPINSLESQQSGGNQPASDFSDQPEGENESDQEKPGETDSYGGTANRESPTTTPSSAGDSSEPEVKTAESLEDSLKNLIDSGACDNVYVELPKLNLDTVIASNKDVHNIINSHFVSQLKKWERFDTDGSPFAEKDAEYRSFKKSAQKEVNYLVKEFECRKAADSYSRSTTARTGILDCTKLHTYKYNEDLFRKVSVIPDGKNHGLVFVLDWSGSMGQVMLDTIKQLYNLIWFCKKVSIPFEVYAFTCEWKRPFYDELLDKYTPANIQPHFEKKENLLLVDETFCMMNLFTSKVKANQLEDQMLNIWRVSCYFSGSRSLYTIPDQLSLSGTPLNESLIALHQILPKFQKENKLQKVQCVILTDGEASPLNRVVSVQRDWEKEPYLGSRRLIPDITFVRDRKLGTTYRVEYQYHKFTDLLLNNLKDNFSYVNFIGIRVLSSRDVNSFIRLHLSYDSKEFQKIQTDWKKQRSFNINNSGYDAYFGISATSLSQDSEFEVNDGATKAQIKSAFVKSLKTKKLNKKVLGEFISLVV